MCGRVTDTLSPAEFRLIFGVEKPGDGRARYNVAPTQPGVIIRQRAGYREALLARWGLVPPDVSVQDARRLSLFNARRETVLMKPMFRGAFRQRRCLWPITGFYYVNGVKYVNPDWSYEQAAKALVSDMQAYNYIWWWQLPNSQRATNPWNYASGLQAYINRRSAETGQNLKLVAKSHYGWGPVAWGESLNILWREFTRETPITGLEFSLGVQHSGVLRSFDKNPYGDLWGHLQVPLGNRASLNLSAWWVPIGGVYWIEEVP
ncbi:SOS response-associated peptidase [Deinococcus sp. YIM 77859]|uniref:SOS response-associated peptidase n=1 Tax=Deinococcus sp. YIM 77859 TaxID=1540221 RepID=UPI00068C6B2F|nr:SOS response-associated peptidase family protein [Deinococcus sp. YIM 77859]